MELSDSGRGGPERVEVKSYRHTCLNCMNCSWITSSFGLEFNAMPFFLSLLPSLLGQGFCHGPSASHCVGHSFNKHFLRTFLISGSELDVGVRHCSASVPVFDCS